MSTDDFIVSRADGLPHIRKDPDSDLRYTWNWTNWLLGVSGEAIVSATVTVEAGLSLISDAVLLRNMVTQEFSGGTAGKSYKAVCRIGTGPVLQLVDERTIVIDVKER